MSWSLLMSTVTSALNAGVVGVGLIAVLIIQKKAITAERRFNGRYSYGMDKC